MTVLSVNTSDTAIFTVKNFDYCCALHNLSKSDSINLLRNYVLEHHRYIKKYCPKFQSTQGNSFYFFVIYIKWLIVNII